MADATGANTKVSDSTESYRTRFIAATALCLAIRDCHPADAAVVLSAALEELSVGTPIAALDSVMAEARLWAEWATPAELKAYALASYEAMPGRDQAAFLAHVSPRAVA